MECPDCRTQPTQSAGRSKKAIVLVSVTIIAVVVLAIALVVVFTRGNGGATSSSNKAINEFTGGNVVSVKDKGSTPYAFGTQTEYQGTWDGDAVSFDVDNKTGEVRGLFRYGQRGDEVNISQGQAETIATAFAREHYKDFESLGLEEVERELIDHGAGTDKSYSFAWQKTDQSTGVILPYSVELRVNASTGKVDSYSSFKAHVTISTKPTVSKDEAGRKSVEAVSSSFPEAKVSGNPACVVTTLPVGEPNGTQSLLWVVPVEVTRSNNASVRGAIVYINALTGKAEKVDPYI